MSLDEPLVVDDALWMRLLELTDGATALCYQCGVCTALCPWGEVRQQPLSVRTFMRQAQLGTRDGNENLWLCTTCAQCQAACPRGVDIVQVFRALRQIAWEERRVEKGLPTLLWSVYWNSNPWTQPPSQRDQWAKAVNIPLYDPSQHEILLYIGCTSSYDSRAQKIARALVQVLRHAGVEFGTLGEDEPCCGESVLSMGHQPYFEEIAADSNKIFQEKGVGTLVTISPHCYDVFKNHYPHQDSGWQALHYTQYLDRLVQAGRLKFETPLETRVVFQDPCYLGRHNNEYEAPRRLLTAIPGIELVELEYFGVDGLCCGGGGGRMWLETPPGERLSDLRIEQVKRSGAATLATACPFCVVCLEDSAKLKNYSNLRVLDIAEITALALKA